MINLVPQPDFLNISNALCQTPLHLAVLTKQPTIVRHLVCMGAALDARDRFGNTPLHLACRDGDLESVKSLTMPYLVTETSSLPMWVVVQKIPQEGDIKNYEGIKKHCLRISLHQNTSQV